MDLERNAPAKPAHGSARRERIRRALKREDKEEAVKRAVRRRDGHCRWPHLTRDERELCARTRREVAHVFAKGMGGDPQLLRTTRELMVWVDVDVHQGPQSFHAQNRRVVFLTPKKTDGALAFEEKRGGRWVRIAEEISVGVLA